ncbi:MAG: hypothetical protein M1834_004669, partial [Cirrosporium novae-zelandiae]
GPSQPIMTEAIRLLSKGPFPAYNFPPPTLKDNESGLVSEKMGSMSTVGDPRRYDYPPLPNHPTTYAQNSCAWLHAFPEGRVHQPSTIGPSPDSPSSQNDYSLLPLKWGVSRLLLETSPRPPLLVPMFIEGFDGIMCEDRPFPRFLPRIGKRLIVIFGEAVDVERDERWKELRERWRKLEKKVKNGVEKEKSVDGGWFWTKAEESRDNSPEIKPMPNGSLSEDNQLGVLSGDLMFGEEAVQIRKECTVLIREEILKLRRRRGWPDEDARQGLRPVIDDPVELEGKGRGKRYLDGSLVGRA